MSSSPPASSLPPILDPCHQVRRTCNTLMEDPESPVSIDEIKIRSLIDNSNNNDLPRAMDDIEWDAEGWHYDASEVSDLELRKERIALYILALDAINFCFWPHPQRTENTLEYEHLAVALTKVAEGSTGGYSADEETEACYFFSPKNLSTLSQADMWTALEPHLNHHLPNLPERCRLWNELGAVLLHAFDGKATNLLNACHGSAPKLVLLLVQHCSGFRDESMHSGTGQWLAFYKRAQICVADLNAALNLRLQNMEQLTTFADYRVPQLLRHVGILHYNPELACAVDENVELSRNQEVFVRAATVVAVDRLVQVYNERARADKGNNESTTCSTSSTMTAVKMDWYLWQVGERLNQDGKMKPHHRVNTIFY